MIPKKTLVDTIDSFVEKYQKINDELSKIDKEDKTHFTFEKFEEWYAMQKAWRELSDVIELKLLPFVEKKN